MNAHQVLARIMSNMEKVQTDVAILAAMHKPASNVDAQIPVLKKLYSKAQAVKAKANIDAAFEAGLITYDKRRGMKMVVTKRTEGWTP